MCWIFNIYVPTVCCVYARMCMHVTTLYELYVSIYVCMYLCRYYVNIDLEQNDTLPFIS